MRQTEINKRRVYGVKKIPSGGRELIETLSSPDTCNVLTKQDLNCYANMQTCGLQIVVSVTDKENTENKVEKFKKKTEALFEEYASFSDFGGNYSYIIGTRPGYRQDEYREALRKITSAYGTEVISMNKTELDISATQIRQMQILRENWFFSKN